MKKISLILAVAFATFTLTSCGEKAPTPEEMKLAITNEIQKAEKEWKAQNDTMGRKDPTDPTGKGKILNGQEFKKLAEQAKKIDSLKKARKSIK